MPQFFISFDGATRSRDFDCDPEYCEITLRSAAGALVHSKKSILRMKTAFIDCAEANFLFVVAICIVLS